MDIQVCELGQKRKLGRQRWVRRAKIRTMHLQMYQVAQTANFGWDDSRKIVGIEIKTSHKVITVTGHSVPTTNMCRRHPVRLCGPRVPVGHLIEPNQIMSLQNFFHHSWIGRIGIPILIVNEPVHGISINGNACQKGFKIFSTSGWSWSGNCWVVCWCRCGTRSGATGRITGRVMSRYIRGCICWLTGWVGCGNGRRQRWCISGCIRWQ